MLPASWDRYSELREVTLSGCGLVGGLPSSWGALSRLERLDLSENLLEGGLPREWGHMAGLGSLDVSLKAALAAVKLSGELPSEWEALRRLRVLDLWNQGVSGVDIHGNDALAAHVWGSGLSLWQSSSLWNKSPICSTLKDTLVAFRMPGCQSQAVQGVHLRQNLPVTCPQLMPQVAGSLPSSWTSMAAMEVVTLGGTQVSGSLPPLWAGMTNLTTLHLADTAVSGKLPPSWGSMENLTWVDLRGTQVDPGLPGSWRAKFCKQGSVGGRPPAFAYLPWKVCHSTLQLRSDSQ